VFTGFANQIGVKPLPMIKVSSSTFDDRYWPAHPQEIRRNTSAKATHMEGAGMYEYDVHLLHKTATGHLFFVMNFPTYNANSASNRY